MRKRPGMYNRDVHAARACTTWCGVIDNGVDEHLAGHCKNIG